LHGRQEVTVVSSVPPRLRGIWCSVSNGPDVSPVITVRLEDVPFRPLLFLGFKPVNLPDFASSITAEDLAGSVSN